MYKKKVVLFAVLCTRGTHQALSCSFLLLFKTNIYFIVFKFYYLEKKAKIHPDTLSRHVDRNLNTKQRNRYRINERGIIKSSHY